MKFYKKKIPEKFHLADLKQFSWKIPILGAKNANKKQLTYFFWAFFYHKMYIFTITIFIFWYKLEFKFTLILFWSKTKIRENKFWKLPNLRLSMSSSKSPNLSTERSIYYRKSVLHVLIADVVQIWYVHLSRCSTELR